MAWKKGRLSIVLGRGWRYGFRYGELYSLNYYKEVSEKDRTHYEVYSFSISAVFFLLPVSAREIVPI
jgi:hypothetical protein